MLGMGWLPVVLPFSVSNRTCITTTSRCWCSWCLCLTTPCLHLSTRTCDISCSRWIFESRCQFSVSSESTYVACNTFRARDVLKERNSLHLHNFSLLVQTILRRTINFCRLGLPHLVKCSNGREVPASRARDSLNRKITE